MKSKSLLTSSLIVIENEIKKLKEEGFLPTLAFVFTSQVDLIPDIMNLMEENRIQVFGASTSGEFTENGMADDATSIVFLDMNLAYFKIEIRDLESQTTAEAGEEIGSVGESNFKNPGYIISSADMQTPGEVVINEIRNKSGNDVNIIGGIAGEPVFFKGLIFTSKEVFNRGLISLILDQDKVILEGTAISGWKPVGTEKTITNCQGTWIHRIDDKPALDVLWKFIGEELVEDESMDSEDIIRLNSTFPLQVLRKNNYAVMRPLLLANIKEKSVMVGGLVHEGEKFRFSLPPDFEVIDEVIASSKRLQESKLPSADAMLIFTCIGRHFSLGPLINEEIEGLAKTWNIPMGGFLALGEFGKAERADQAEFHGTTCSWAVIKEI